MKITFFGAAQKVTGSKHLITTLSGKNILLDCGLFQGEGSETVELNRHFGFDPRSIDVLILSHAHTDHAGAIPYLYKQGFRGKIYCTKGTLDLCQVMLLDSAHIQEHDIEYVNKRRHRRGMNNLEPLYTAADVRACLKNFNPVDFNQVIQVNDECEFMFTESGHILGSAAVNIIIRENGLQRRLFFSGDIGRYNDLILKPPAPFPQAEIIICESTYGDRLHDEPINASQRLMHTVLNTCVKKKGKLIIPAFSLGRTQEVIYTLDRLHTQRLIPHVKTYIDSPLAVNITGIMQRHLQSFNPEIKKYMQTDPNPFSYDDVTFITEVQESKALNDSDEPCIIISASGMIEAGRVKHHVKNNIGDSRNTVLIVGYCPPESIGGKLINGDPYVRIFGKEYEVHAEVEVISSYSAHADYKEMLNYLSCQNPAEVKKLFLVHGIPEAQQAFRQRLLHKGFNNVYIPFLGESFEV